MIGTTPHLVVLTLPSCCSLQCNTITKTFCSCVWNDNIVSRHLTSQTNVINTHVYRAGTSRFIVVRLKPDQPDQWHQPLCMYMMHSVHGLSALSTLPSPPLSFPPLPSLSMWCVHACVFVCVCVCVRVCADPLRVQ